MNLNLDDYFKIEMQVRDELVEEVLKDMDIIYGNSPEIRGVAKLATLKALLSGPRRIRERREQNV